MEIKPTKLTTDILMTIINEKPCAYAMIQGQNNIRGTVCFYPYLKGSIMVYEINHLPETKKCEGGVFAFHIHEGESCQNDTDVPYEKTGKHFNPQQCEHPFHLGDLSPLFSSEGKAWAIVYIDKFKPKDIIGRTIVIHAHADDFHSQPAGNSGNKIACGEIKSFY